MIILMMTITIIYSNYNSSSRLDLRPSLLMMTQEAFVDSVDQDQTAHSVQSDLDLHCPHFHSRL